MKPARVIVADPPWMFGDSLPGKGRGARKHYPCMTTAAIAEFVLPPIADDAYLFLWRVSAMPSEALFVAEEWGFTPKAEIVWNKKTKTGKPFFGMGRHTRSCHETCILATRGKPKPRARNVRDAFDATVGRHSEKPVEFYELVERLASGPFVELFARRQRDGWTCFGNEVSK